MTQEEKAKRYDETLEIAKKNYITAQDLCEGSQIDVECFKNTLVNIFPELKESEDERIRKDIIEMLRNWASIHYITKEQFSERMAWLEKQGEKPQGKTALEAIKEEKVDNTNKIEPNINPHFGKPNKVKLWFKDGDWITNGEYTWKVISVDYLDYTLQNQCGECVEDTVDYVNKAFHLWTIQDAKEGDVIWHVDSASNGISIFREIRHDGKVLCYCDYDSEDHFCTGEYHTCCWSQDKYIKPATKEQCNLLFQKMKEAGYEWDAGKKELNKEE